MSLVTVWVSMNLSKTLSPAYTFANEKSMRVCSQFELSHVTLSVPSALKVCDSSPKCGLKHCDNGRQRGLVPQVSASLTCFVLLFLALAVAAGSRSDAPAEMLLLPGVALLLRLLLPAFSPAHAQVNPGNVAPLRHTHRPLEVKAIGGQGQLRSTLAEVKVIRAPGRHPARGRSGHLFLPFHLPGETRCSRNGNKYSAVQHTGSWHVASGLK